MKMLHSRRQVTLDDSRSLPMKTEVTTLSQILYLQIILKSFLTINLTILIVFRKKFARNNTTTLLLSGKELQIRITNLKHKVINPIKTLGINMRSRINNTKTILIKIMKRNLLTVKTLTLRNRHIIINQINLILVKRYCANETFITFHFIKVISRRIKLPNLKWAILLTLLLLKHKSSLILHLLKNI
jgi:hypothetical protein